MANSSTYVGIYDQLKNLPTLVKSRNTILKGNKTSYLAKESKLYDKSGEIIESSSSPDKLKLTEEYFKKIKGFTWYSEMPFFKKVSETDGVKVKAIRTNGKNSSSLTNYDINGIRTTKLTQKYNPETQQYDYKRILFNEKGTKPQVVSSWKGEYTPLDTIE